LSSNKPIILNSFLRKSLKAFALKALVRSSGAELNRIGRSRHWQLIASNTQLNEIINLISESEEPSWQWLAKYLQTQKQQLTHQELLALVKRNKGISVNELVAKTDCSIAMARQVIDELEWMD
jgi:hypothetical protein